MQRNSKKSMNYSFKDITNAKTILKKCAWWCSLKSMPETDNSSSKTININSKYSYRMWIYTTI
jgi:hypothetical protein